MNSPSIICFHALILTQYGEELKGRVPMIMKAEGGGGGGEGEGLHTVHLVLPVFTSRYDKVVSWAPVKSQDE